MNLHVLLQQEMHILRSSYVTRTWTYKIQLVYLVSPGMDMVQKDNKRHWVENNVW